MQTSYRTTGSELTRVQIEVRGVVQGVGFRPYVYQLATALGLTGWVSNNPQGVQIEAEGRREAVEAFLARLEPERPPHAVIQSLEPRFLDPVGYTTFVIRPSETGGDRRALILPDLATCADCLRELFDPHNRRYRYPFINCTHCGPRYSIIQGLPYDRANTTMRGFALCADCRREYEDPADRRFHAQPNACPVCGPHLELWDPDGLYMAREEEALRMAAGLLRQGGVLALKGLGGFHLMTDARREEAVRALRERKRREEKPFALMLPTLQAARAECEVSEQEARLLCSPQAPIVLLSRRKGATVAPSVAPGSPNLGVMLPYTPLHHLLMAELDLPVIATSGNLSDEPICTDERDALTRLRGIADAFLVHNRPIARHVDDSVARLVLGRELILRRARGYAPLPIALRHAPPSALAVGAHLKNAVALSVGDQAFVSQHIGDLETEETYRAFRQVIEDLARLFETPPQRVVCDLHPDYLSTRYAERCGLPVTRVQHHRAHVLSCMAENDLEGAVLGVAWDGTGYGDDGTIWGGEFFIGSPRSADAPDGERLRRAAHLRTFRLPGGDQAVREPRRTALGLLYELLGAEAFEREEIAAVAACSSAERAMIAQMLTRGVNAPVTSSVGRLFDGVAAIAGIRQTVRYEGQAAVEWEALAAGEETSEAYPLPLKDGADGLPVLDWEPMLIALLEDMRAQAPLSRISARFHNALVEGIAQAARRMGEERVVLTGGCFLNRRLLEGAVHRLLAEGFRPYWHQRVPPGDGGIALGQLAALRARAATSAH
jgi:hydrogenase maturation protein HypF